MPVQNESWKPIRDLQACYTRITVSNTRKLFIYAGLFLYAFPFCQIFLDYLYPCPTNILHKNISWDNFTKKWSGFGGSNSEKTMVLVLHKELEYKVEKL